MHAKLLPSLLSKMYGNAPKQPAITSNTDINNHDYLRTRKRLQFWVAATILTGWIILLLIAYVVFKNPTPSANTWTGWNNVRYMFVLYVSPQLRIMSSGASYCSVGYNVSGDHPNEKNIIGNPPFPGKPQTNGLNWVCMTAQFKLILGGIFSVRVQ
jgi:hypothetical protein